MLGATIALLGQPLDGQRPDCVGGVQCYATPDPSQPDVCETNWDLSTGCFMGIDICSGRLRLVNSIHVALVAGESDAIDVKNAHAAPPVAVNSCSRSAAEPASLCVRLSSTFRSGRIHSLHYHHRRDLVPAKSDGPRWAREDSYNDSRNVTVVQTFALCGSNADSIGYRTAPGRYRNPAALARQFFQAPPRGAPFPEPSGPDGSR